MRSFLDVDRPREVAMLRMPRRNSQGTFRHASACFRLVVCAEKEGLHLTQRRASPEVVSSRSSLHLPAVVQTDPCIVQQP